MSRWHHHCWPAAPAFAALALSGVIATPVLASEKAFSWTHDDPELEWMECPPFMPEGCGLVVLQGNPAEHNADVFFRLPRRATAPHHWHTSAERMVLITGELHTGYDDQDPVVMEPGTYAYGPAELPHDASCVSDDDCVLFIAFEEPVDATPLEPRPPRPTSRLRKRRFHLLRPGEPCARAGLDPDVPASRIHLRDPDGRLVERAARIRSG